MAYYSDTTTDSIGNPVEGVQVTVYERPAAGATPAVLATLTDNDGSPLGNPVASAADGLFYFNAPTGDYVLSFKLASATRPFHSETVNLNDAIRGDLAATTGSSLVGHILNATGAAATTVQAKLRKIVHATDFTGVDPTGTTNSTTGLLNFFQHCIDDQVEGMIPAGTYLVTPGVLAFDNGFVETPFPTIYTAGFKATVFKVDPATTDTTGHNAPILQFSNGTATSGIGQYWQGGFLGGIGFIDQTGHTTATSRHAIQLRGCQGVMFGHSWGNPLNGDLYNLDQKTFGGNPDPYHMAACQFLGAELYNSVGRPFTNANGQGWNGCEIWFIRGTDNIGGGLKGFGAGNKVRFASFGSCKGKAFDSDTASGSALFGFDVQEDEIDNCEYALDATNYRGLRFRGRIIHRYATGALNTSGKYWPLKALNIGSSGVGITEADILVDHRIDAGGTLADLGVFLDFNNTGVADFYYAQNVIDNASLSIPDSALFANFSSSGSGDALVRRDGRIILRNTKRRMAYAYASGTPQVVNSGTGTSAAIMTFGAEKYDESGDYDTSAYGFTCPWTGKCRFRGQFFAPVAVVGQFIRFYVLRNRGGTYSTALYGRTYHGTTNAELHQLAGEIDVVAGDILYFAADTNAAAAQAITAVISHPTDNFAQYEMVV